MAFLPALALPLMIASTVMSAVGAVTSAAGQSNAAKAGAKVDELNAQQAQTEGMLQGEAARRQGSQAEGEAAATIGASGVQSGTGTALQTLRESAINSQYDVLNARYSAQSRATAYDADAAMKKSEAKADTISGYIGAGSTLLKGASSIAGGLGGAGGGFGGSGLSMPLPNAYGIRGSDGIY